MEFDDPRSLDPRCESGSSHIQLACVCSSSGPQGPPSGNLCLCANRFWSSLVDVSESGGHNDLNIWRPKERGQSMTCKADTGLLSLPKTMVTGVRSERAEEITLEIGQKLSGSGDQSRHRQYTHALRIQELGTTVEPFCLSYCLRGRSQLL